MHVRVFNLYSHHTAYRKCFELHYRLLIWWYFCRLTEPTLLRYDCRPLPDKCCAEFQKCKITWSQTSQRYYSIVWMFTLSSSRRVKDGRMKREEFVNYKRRWEEDSNEAGDACAALNESKMKEERVEERLKDKSRCNWTVGVKWENGAERTENIIKAWQVRI